MNKEFIKAVAKIQKELKAPKNQRNNFGNYNKLYGSIGTLIVILLWIYFNSLVVLLGFDLNASIREAKKNKETLLNPDST